MSIQVSQFLVNFGEWKISSGYSQNSVVINILLQQNLTQVFPKKHQLLFCMHGACMAIQIWMPPLKAIKLCHIHHFADGTNVLHSHVNIGMKNRANWLNADKKSLLMKN